MELITLVKAAILGLIEGLTEFIPVSSTGHMIIMGYLMEFKSTGKAFEVMIQLGAILAIVLIYFQKLLGVVLCLPSDPWARRFATSIFLAFFPAALLGLLLSKYIKSIFDKPILVCIALILGGIILVFVDKIKFETKENNTFHIAPLTALKIGLFQCLALFPGVSRSGSTIVGALVLGVEKRAAAEFSFFLAIPMMVGAFSYDLYKNYSSFNKGEMVYIAVGFACAFISGYFVVRYILDYIKSHGFALFGYWRIIVGTIGILLITFVK